MAEELPLFLGLNDKTVTDIPKTVEKQRYMGSVAPKAANPGRWVEMPRLPIPTGEHAVIECQGKIHVIAGYAKHRVDQPFHQVYDSKTRQWSLKAPFPHPCNHVAGVSIGSKIYTFGGFVEQNRCPHSKCFVYDTATDEWAAIAPISRPRGAISAIVLDGKIHLLGGRDVRSVEWHEVYDPASNKYSDRAAMRGSTGTQPFVGQRDHMGVAVVDGKIHAIAGRMDSYVEKFQAAGGSLVMLAKGNRSQQVTDACAAHGGFYLGSIGGPAARLAQDCIRHVEVLEYEELGMEAVWRIEVEDFPAFIIVDDKGHDFFQEVTTPVNLTAKA